eukprot:TRINITY_DN14473_c0_g1_i1.p1 TRINITY_DN14473_c0_g1~~TRINITY_DN14473_c0_g1_i1.p1  ORF type:complete len:333 (+),score=80.12 TRINITY_DN14473_c0_g1_i1:83-1081(+)
MGSTISSDRPERVASAVNVAPAQPPGAVPPANSRRLPSNLRALQPDDAWNVRDLDILQFRYPQLRPPPAAPVQQSLHIRSDINLPRDAIAISQTESASIITCNIDVNVESILKIYFIATVAPGSDVITCKSGSPASVVKLPAGLAQSYAQPAAEGLPLDQCEPQELTYVPSTNTFPVILTLETIPPADSTVQPQIQTTFCSLERSPSGAAVLRVLKQEIKLEGVLYSLQEIYGMGHTDSAHRDHATTEDDDDSAECVVCMNEPREVMVLPCRHMCLCQGCADMLRFQSNKCPICRAFVQQLLRVQVAQQDGMPPVVGGDGTEQKSPAAPTEV